MNSNNKTARDVSCFQTSGALLKAASDWASIVENFPYGLGALIFYILLFQSTLIPRWLSVWGLIGATLLVAMGVLRMFGHPVIYLAIPIILNELVLAVWLIVAGFNSSAIVYAIVGVLFITALASSMLSGGYLKSKDDPDYLTAVSANEKQVLIGVLLMVILTISVVSIPIMMFPILREHNESLALLYVGARIFEGFFDIVIALGYLLLLTLSQEFVKAGTPTAETDSNETN
ncbi:DUF4386 domain-containing protein [Candidatus Bathyarchaeota archaeon]|nr:DUF4386 domain-containing protein [Candidatus Bathyarchaeota archaeon]